MELHTSCEPCQLPSTSTCWATHIRLDSALHIRIPWIFLRSLPSLLILSVSPQKGFWIIRTIFVWAFCLIFFSPLFFIYFLSETFEANATCTREIRRRWRVRCTSSKLFQKLLGISLGWIWVVGSQVSTVRFKLRFVWTVYI